MSKKQIEKQMYAEAECTVFLLINSSSGGNIGKSLVEQEVKKVQFELEHESKHINVHVYFCNMRDNNQRKRMFELLREYTLVNKKVFAIACGGDGTIMWIVSEMVKNSIDCSKVFIATIPLGTGNDFSQELGWGKTKSTLVQKSYRSLKKLICKWLKAQVQSFDLWDVEACVYPQGKLQKVDSNTHENYQLKEKSICVTFCNYFSFGLDGKIGYSFDKHRSKSRTGNLILYGLLGLVKNMTKTQPLPALVESFVILESNKEDHSTDKINKEICQSIVNYERSTIFTTNTLNLAKGLILQKEYVNLLALNINSFMGGVKNIWQNASDPYNVGTHSTPVSTSDGKLEFMSFNTGMGMAIERIFGGMSEKINQGTGPYELTFNKSENPKHRTYLQIDGQFTRITHPKSITICQSKLVPGGKIKVLRNV